MGERIKEAALPASIVTAAALIGGGFYAGGNSGVSIGEMSRTMTRMEGTLAKMDAKLDPLGDQVARLEYWRDAVTPVIAEHGEAIKSLLRPKP